MNLNAVNSASFSNFFQQLTEELKEKENQNSIWTTNQGTSGATNLTGVNPLLPNELSANNNLLQLLGLFLSNGQAPTINNNVAAVPRQNTQAINNNVGANNPGKTHYTGNGAYLILSDSGKGSSKLKPIITYDGDAEIRTTYRHNSDLKLFEDVITTDENGNKTKIVKEYSKRPFYTLDPNDPYVKSISVYDENNRILEKTIGVNKYSDHYFEGAVGKSYYDHHGDGSVTGKYYDLNGNLTRERTERPPDEDGLFASVSKSYEDGKLVKEGETIGTGAPIAREDSLRLAVAKDHEKGTTLVSKNQAVDYALTTERETYDASGNLTKWTRGGQEYYDAERTRRKSAEYLTSEFTKDGELDAFKIEERNGNHKTITEYKDGEMTRKQLDLVNGKYVVTSQEEVSKSEQNELKAKMSEKPTTENSLKEELTEKSVLLQEDKAAAAEEAQEKASSAVKEAKAEASTAAQEAKEAQEEVQEAQEKAADNKKADSIKDKISKNVSAITDD